MGYCSISPTCRTVSEPLAGRRAQAGPGREAAPPGAGPCAAGSARPPRRGAGTSEGGGDGTESAVTAFGTLGQALFVAQDPAAFPPSPRWELGRKKPLRVRRSFSPPSGFICFPVLMPLWIINFLGGGLFVLLLLSLGLLSLFTTSWIGLGGESAGTGWERTETEPGVVAGEKWPRRSEGLAVKSQPARSRPHLLGTRIFRGVGSPHRSPLILRA